MIEVLQRLMIILERIRNMEVMNNTISIGIFGAIAAFGILNCILGYRLLRFWMMLSGFAIGAGAGFGLVYNSGIQEKYIYLAAMVALGIVLAIVAFLIYKAGIFILGAGLGLTLSIYIFHPTTSFVFFVCLLVGVGLGVLAMRFEKGVIIVGTSLLGGVMGGVALAKIGGMAEVPYGIGMSVGLAVLGMLIQFAINKDDGEEEDEEEEVIESTKSRQAEAAYQKEHLQDSPYDDFDYDDFNYDDFAFDEYDFEEKERREERKRKTQPQTGGSPPCLRRG